MITCQLNEVTWLARCSEIYDVFMDWPVGEVQLTWGSNIVGILWGLQNMVTLLIGALLVWMLLILHIRYLTVDSPRYLVNPNFSDDFWGVWVWWYRYKLAMCVSVPIWCALLYEALRPEHRKFHEFVFLGEGCTEILTGQYNVMRRMLKDYR